MTSAFTANDAKEILADYWGYNEFRPCQQDIVMSVLNGNDTLGLMPTGGGKSITFQVPALLLDGVTVVVTPLISLMKDQVDNLKARGIKAAYLYSGMSLAEQRLAIERCRFKKIKILYLSPEKLCSSSFIDTLRTLPVELIVVDEAHCISQWGYDFRPSYLKIKMLRHVHPGVPILALTATATPDVAADIKSQLEFREGSNTFTLSFARNNISFIVNRTPDKNAALADALLSTAGSAIVYVRSRKRTREIALFLSENGISAEYYHAGLAPEDKNERQTRWKADATRVMVATNAFGMGIDKADVRTVVHYDLPSSLEEYYQEAGRAGRDGKPSTAVVLASDSDKGLLSRRLSSTFPPKDEIRRIYDLASDFLGVSPGDGFNRVYEFNFPLFCERFSLNPTIAHNALSIISRAGYIEYVHDATTSSRIMIIMLRDELYDLRLPPVADRLLQTILRSYTGLFADYVPINESVLAGRLSITAEEVYENLLMLNRMNVISYVPRRTTPYIYYITSREEGKHTSIPIPVYEDRRRSMEQRIDAMKRFVFGVDRCRVEMMLEYFGEKDTKPCGTCDYCRAIAAAQRQAPTFDHEAMRAKILKRIGESGKIGIGDAARHAGGDTEAGRAAAMDVIRRMADNGEIKIVGIEITGIDSKQR